VAVLYNRYRRGQAEHVPIGAITSQEATSASTTWIVARLTVSIRPLTPGDEGITTEVGGWNSGTFVEAANA
jgi:hypothetical protein